MSINVEAFAVELIGSMSEGVVLADRAGVIQWWNGGAEKMFGYTSAEAIGQSLDLIIPDNLRARHWEGYARTMETGESRYGPGDLLSVPAIRKDGSRLSVAFTIVPFRDPAEHITAIAAVMRDVTAQFDEMRNLRKRLGQYMAAEAKGAGENGS